MALWIEYIKLYVQPRVPMLYTSWDKSTSPHYNTSFYRSLKTGRLYEKVFHARYNIHEAIRNQPGSRTTTFHTISLESTIDADILRSLEPVDVTHSKHNIKILCISNINKHGQRDISNVQSKYSWYRKLPKSLRRLCGKISLPPDGGVKLMEYITERDASLIGVSDASVIEGNGTHAWILTTGEKDHISDPHMKLEGYGTVDGDTIAMSSARGELQSQTALTIITEAFLSEHNANEMAVTFYTDNLGVQKCCTNPKINHIGHHRKANMDLQMEHASQKAKMSIKHEWVRGHQDKDPTWETVDELCEL
jgi:hypothetical protein